jgi:ABC-2 type transport system ATP-binding protein
VRARRGLDHAALSNLPGVSEATAENGSASLRVRNPAETVTHLVRYLDSQGNELVDLAVWRPTLEDVFLSVTGERLTGEED